MPSLARGKTTTFSQRTVINIAASAHSQEGQKEVHSLVCTGWNTDFQARNGILCTGFWSMRSMHSTGTWTQTSFNTSHVQGPRLNSKWWSHLHCWHLRNWQGITMDLVLELMVYLRSQIDCDFIMSIVQAHIDNHDYQVNDRILCYFAFPRIGLAVALWPGDFLLSNPEEPHSISSCCRTGDEMFCIFSYL